MAGVKALVGLSFSGAIGLTFLMLGCALEYYGFTCLVLSDFVMHSLPDIEFIVELITGRARTDRKREL
ncbi:hypothetical protein ASZ78_013894 [Callipepla squamata]|uniref:Uncharacterized protein n=1 Tax=Callipepla squamata TaxID=9009 RepID=A0A226NG82_CALSU|nr:hypothetical protein ASZ78_013894 [Callipepla squamata]